MSIIDLSKVIWAEPISNTDKAFIIISEFNITGVFRIFV
jgi:hypothetical protein